MYTNNNIYKCFLTIDFIDFLKILFYRTFIKQWVIKVILTIIFFFSKKPLILLTLITFIILKV
jgi:hypothetical protein